jgi:phosphatidylglycerol:prolipoprotein diacylglycerol transferase
LARDVARLLGPKVGLGSVDAFQKTWDLFAWVIPMSLVGGRIFYVLENHTEFQGQWLDAFKIWQGGLVFYGGLLGAIVAALVWMRSQGWPAVFFFDIAAPYILLGHALGRVGCYLEGCCSGVVDTVHGVVFPGLGDGLPHLPTQLWELYGDVALFLILLAVRKRVLDRPGVSFALYAFTYGLLRYVIEFWRRDGSLHYMGVFLSPSQAVSAIISLVALLYLGWAFSRRTEAPKV